MIGKEINTVTEESREAIQDGRGETSNERQTCKQGQFQNLGLNPGAGQGGK